MCNEVWYICENFRGPLKMGRKGTIIFSVQQNRVVYKIFFQPNEIARFDGLNLFCYLSAQCVVAINAGEGLSRIGILWGLPPLSLVDMLHGTGGGFHS